MRIYEFTSNETTPRIAVLIPCLNEEKTIAKVVDDFKNQLPGAQIFVFDNNSSDQTALIAKSAGAMVIPETRQGKGFVVQSMFHKVDADIYVMVDGDDTYPAELVCQLIAPVLCNEADMVVGSRLIHGTNSEFKILNRFGNYLFLVTLKTLFKSGVTDILSGYRVMSREFVKTTPIFSTGFEIEIELTIKALQRGYRILEIPTTLRPRPIGSKSKIKIVHDGILLLTTIFLLFRDYKPLAFFALIGIFLMLMGLIPGIIVISEFLATGLILHMPSVVLAVGLELAGIICFLIGLVLDVISRRFRELEHELYSLLRK